MMRTLVWSVVCPVLLLAGCGGEGGEGSSAEPPATAPAEKTSALTEGAVQRVALGDETVEVGCGACLYHLPRVHRCQPAVLVDGSPILLTVACGGEPNHDLCERPGRAVVSGSVQGDRFVAGRFDIQ